MAQPSRSQFGALVSHRILTVVERQTNHLQPVVALVELQDLALADHAVVVGDDPELGLNTHACPKDCNCQSDYLSAGGSANQPRPPHLAMSHAHADVTWIFKNVERRNRHA
jgi:hypothetical protein